MTGRSPNAAISAPPSVTADGLFDALAGDPRRRAIALLTRYGELCVCELTGALGISQPKMSRHLAILREAGLVGVRREGVWMHYRVTDDLPEWACGVLDAALRALLADPAFRDQCGRLERLPERPGSRCRN